MSPNLISRRALLTAAGAAPFALSAKGKKVPIGLELYSVRDEMSKDEIATVKRVAKMGYEVVEFYGPYYNWTLDKAKEMRKVLDDVNVKCLSTHNGNTNFKPENIDKAIDLNRAIGSKYIVMASSGGAKTLDDWKRVADLLTQASAKLKTAGMTAGYHNHQTEFKPVDGKRPIEVIAAGTPKDMMLQLDIGTCIEAGSDPVAWINANPGRIKSIHCKEWSSKGGGYKVLFGEGDAKWKDIFAAAQKKGGVEYYLIEQEGASVPSFQAVEACLASMKKVLA